MALQSFIFQCLRSITLSTGVAFLLANGSAMAAPRTTNSSPTNSSNRSVVVDTNEDGGTATRQTPTDRSSSSVYSATRFSCQPVNGEYTVVYQPESEPGKYFAWAKPAQMGGGWSPQKRCYEIARRLESYRPDGLQEMTTGVENSYNTVCVTTQKVPGCRIVFTVPDGQDPVATRDRVFDNLTVADSGQQTDAVNTYTSRGNDGIGNLLNRGREILGNGVSRPKSKNINLRPFLDRNDGGTGSQLQGGVSLQRNNSSTQLNPANFR
ncbi:MAG TPA: hypothetical protein DEV81_14760 [Cyanobacteria bacterium UBA11049]|nr:hypothetical protein [Cyanobacteria bacterium UBA11049]